MSACTPCLPELTLLGRAGCHLCEEMRAGLTHLSARLNFTVRWVDISGQTELETRYGWDIPVLLAGEHEVCRHFLDESALRGWLQGRVR
mgnify:CR=1 FL=1